MVAEFDEAEVVRQVTERLVEKFPKVQPGEIEGIVREEVAALAAGSVTDYVSVLSERSAKKRLKR